MHIAHPLQKTNSVVATTGNTVQMFYSGVNIVSFLFTAPRCDAKHKWGTLITVLDNIL